MASFSVDITDIIFAGGRTGSKVVTISNAPSGGIGISNTGYGTHFRVVVKEENVSYSIETKAANTSDKAYDSKIRFYNKEDSNDYVEITITQYSVTTIKAYTEPDHLAPTPSTGLYNFTLGNQEGSADLYIDLVEGGLNSIREMTSYSDWLSVTQETPALSDTGFYHYTINYTSNTSEEERRGQIHCKARVSGNVETIIIDAYQGGGAPAASLSISPTSSSVGNLSGTVEITVSSSGISDISYSISDSWITYLSKRGSVYTFSYEANRTADAREGSITFSGGGISQTFTLSQESGNLSATPSSLLFTKEGGVKKTLSVTYRGTLDFPAVLPSWISLVYYGGYPREFDITPEENTSEYGRQYNLIFSDDISTLIVPIIQYGTSSPSLSVSPSSGRVTNESGKIGIQTFAKGIRESDIRVDISDSWLSFESSYNYTFYFNYLANSSGSSRTATVTFSALGKSATYTLTQSAESPASSITVSPSSLSFGPDASYADISLTYGGTYYNTDAAEVHTWVTVNLSDTETGKAAGTVSVASNTTTESRSGNVYFSDELGASIALPIEQAGISFALSANPSTLNIPAKGGSVTTAVTYEGTLSAASLPSWLSETHTDTDANHRTYTVTAASNGPTQERTFNWRLDDDYNHCFVYISQVAAEVPSMVISPTSGSVGSSAGTVDITVRSTNISDISYSISDSWITYSSKSGSVYTFSYEDNTTTSQRQGTITFSGGGISKTYTLTQAAGEVTPTEPTLTISPVSKSVSNTSGSVNVTVTSSNISDVSYSISGDWITYSSKSGDVYTFNYTANTTTSQRQGTITFSGGGLTKTFTLTQEGQGGSNPLSVSPTELNFTASGDTKSVTVSGGTGTIAVNTGSFPSWLSIASVGNGVYNITASENSGVSRSFDVWFTDEAFTTVIVKVSQSGAPGPEPEPVEDRSLKVYPKKLRYYSDGGRILVSFTNRPDSGIGYEITYTDGSGWLSVEGVSPNMYVSATANDGIRRRAEIKFYDLSDNTNYVIVPVIQGSVGGYNSIWMDDLYYPENRDTSGNYFYKVVNQDTGQIYFMGISSKPLSWTGNIGGIDIPRLVDNYIKSDFVQQNTGEDWADMHSGYCTVDIYNMAETNSVVDATFKYWNDWSRFEKKYDYTRSLNDPINGKGCNNMIIPFCVYYDDAATFTIVDTEKNGNINTYTLSSPTSPFVMRYNSYYDIKKLEYKQDDDVLFSYDMNHCGPGAFIYRNRFGGWDSFLIEGNISKTDNYTKQNYRIKGEYNQEYVINTLKYIDEKRTDSIDIDTTYEASTGWLTDEESERLVFHLLSSPIVYFQNLHKENQLYDTDSLDIIPVRITASSSEYKKFRNGRRLVNYLITFEKCNIEKVRQ